MLINFIKSNFIQVAPYKIADFLQKVEECCIWLSTEIGLDIKGRIPFYIKNINNYEKLRGSFNNEMYYCLHSIHEMNQIVSFYESLKPQKSAHFKSTVKDSIYGLNFRSESQKPDDDKSRNFLFELITASDYSKSGFNVDLTQQTDVIINNPRMLIECKRVQSEAQIEKRIKKATSQIKERNTVEESPLKGIVYIDITGIFDQSHSIYVENETGFPFSTVPPSEDQDVIRSMYHNIGATLQNFIKIQEEKLIEFTNENMVGVSSVRLKVEQI